MKNGLQTRVDSVIDDAISKKRIVGTVIQIALDGTIVYQRPAGFADREEGRTMTIIASMFPQSASAVIALL